MTSKDKTLDASSKPDYEAMRRDGGGREQAEGELLPVIDELVLKIEELEAEKKTAYVLR